MSSRKDNQDDKKHKKFQKLPEEWRNGVLATKNPDEINRMIRDAAVLIVESKLAKELDEDLLRIREELKTAEQQYKDDNETNTLRIEFLVEALRAMGIAMPSFSKKAVLRAARASAAMGIAGDTASKSSTQDARESPPETDLDEALAKAEKDAAESHKRVDELVEAAAPSGKHLKIGSEVLLTIEGQPRRARIDSFRKKGAEALCVWMDSEDEECSDYYSITDLAPA